MPWGRENILVKPRLLLYKHYSRWDISLINSVSLARMPHFLSVQPSLCIHCFIHCNCLLLFLCVWCWLRTTSLLVQPTDADREQYTTHSPSNKCHQYRQTTVEMAAVAAVDRHLSETGVRIDEDRFVWKGI